ncbi:hypothetical protein Purlil1_262 [Purpureocillium lilacinum]|uniref:Uncharacterized protein n=1 Tax=Purpureocillium lilacinum TaxID=33203 RepID=A0ABR0CHT4_PURLI|nr:hypothetical protein Purlil1_262 [Purpureocillium lilacinum]
MHVRHLATPFLGLTQLVAFARANAQELPPASAVAKHGDLNTSSQLPWEVFCSKPSPPQCYPPFTVCGSATYSLTRSLGHEVTDSDRAQCSYTCKCQQSPNAVWKYRDTQPLPPLRPARPQHTQVPPPANTAQPQGQEPQTLLLPIRPAPQHDTRPVLFNS